MSTMSTNNDTATTASVLALDPAVVSHSSSCSSESVRNSIAAGYIAGVSGVLVGHPFESVKVWLQTNSEGQNKHLTSTASATTTTTTTPSAPTSNNKASTRIQVARPFAGASATMSTMATQTPSSSSSSSTISSTNKGVFILSGSNLLRCVRAMYSGISGPLLSVGLIQSANFAIYDTTRRYLHRGNDTNYMYHDDYSNIAIAGFTAGGVLSCFTSPLVMIKTNQQVTGNGFRQALLQVIYTTTTSATTTKNNNNNNTTKSSRPKFSRLFRGFGPHFVSETVGRSLYYSMYEYLKRGIVAMRTTNDNDYNVGDNNSVTLVERMACAGFTGIVCWTLIFPLDSVRSRMFSSSSTLPHVTSREMIINMYREHQSFKSFYRGLGITIIRAGPVAAVVLPIYDLTLEYLSATTTR